MKLLEDKAYDAQSSGSSIKAIITAISDIRDAHRGVHAGIADDGPVDTRTRSKQLNLVLVTTALRTTTSTQLLPLLWALRTPRAHRIRPH